MEVIYKVSKPIDKTQYESYVTLSKMEDMSAHRVLKQATARPPASNMLQQQDKFDSFMQEYNFERPHEGIQIKKPASLYEPSTRI